MTRTPADVSRTTEEVVTDYYRVVADLSSSEADLRAMLDPAVRVVEHPNPITPRGAVRDLEAVIAGFLAGKRLLDEQAFDLHEMVVSGERAAVRASWRGVVGAGAGPFHAGDELSAQVAAFLTVRNGQIVDHETFDCYPPLD